MPFGLGFFATAGAGAAGSFDLLETQVLGSSQASVTFNSLSTYASTYKHLQIRYAARSTRAAQDSNMSLKFNSDSGTYRWHVLEAYGSGSPISSTGSSTSMIVATESGNTNVSGSFAAGTIDILDAFDTTKNKVTRSLSGYVGGNHVLSLRSGLWVNTAAISSIQLLNWDGADHAQYSRFSLYGVK